MDAWLDDMPRRPTPKHPGDGLRYAVRAAAAFFGDHAPEDVTREECRAYIARRRAEGRADGTIRKELGALGAALNWRYGKANPAIVELPPAGRPRERWLTRAELARLLAAAEARPHVALFIHLAIATGGRREALLGLTWSAHVDFDAGETGRIWLGFKAGGKARGGRVPMTNTLRAVLLRAREAAVSDWVIDYGGAPVKDIRKALSAAYARAKIDGVDAPAHVLKHTAGAYMAIDGVALLEIARRLQHASVAVSEKHYAHLHPDYMQASSAALEIGR